MRNVNECFVLALCLVVNIIIIIIFLMPSGVQVPKAKNKKLKTNIVVASGPTTIIDGLP